MKEIIADRAKLIDASGIRKVFALGASLKDPVDFSIGQPDFDVPETLKQEAIQAIRAGQNKYSQTAGDEILKQRIAQRISDEYGWENPAVIVSSGVSGGLMLAFMATINLGDEVIIPDPYFVIYKHVVTLLGGKCVFVTNREAELADPGILVIRHAPCEELLAPLIGIVPAQLLANGLASARGIVPGKFRWCTKVTRDETT